MMVKPTTAELLAKTNDNKFRLVIATAKRAYGSNRQTYWKTR